ncbi:hypothetical protein I302_100778 [Kwoniella bestiolae CBS 10118]|uniref:Negative regulation of transcription from Pol III promoter-related protein n=1 Tax=Kwoniella bestiolae CBS 10118 TaxID=1296100 RepID=A0A1B9G617_9TREE|nr:hypothetical protein I302_04151 [Kwoniella bestiolae CBS 10118]OCF26466.1 hypothetical protein I302_04151 [Kwoniella bestiolae CBS 10118]
MKYLDYPILNQLSASLSSNDDSDLQVHARFEAYSVKPVGKEKRAFKEREEAYMSEQEGMEEMSFSPEMREAGLASCFGRLDEKESRKVHFLLVSTLNAAFPDHDFTSLRPDHFTRERSAAQVLSHLSGSLLGSSGVGNTPIILSQLASFTPPTTHKSSPVLSPANSSPNLGPSVPYPDLYRILNEVLPMEDCEVYSWFPEPEYDPHIDTSTAPSEDEDDDIFLENDKMDLDDSDIDPSWGAGGMELDVDEERLESVPMMRQNSTSGGATAPRRGSESALIVPNDWDLTKERKVNGLLWSANYFFYSKRQKRVLFLTCWCRNRPLHPMPQIESAFPVQISASFSSPSSSFEHLVPLVNSAASRTHRYTHHHSHNHRKSKSNLRTISKSGDSTSSTIPIRGIERPSYSQQIAPATPRTSRLASSAPGGNVGFGTKSPMTKMMAGGFKPKQTPARAAMNAQQQQQQQSQQPAIDITSSTSSSRTRERSGSTTPGPSVGSTSALTAGLRGNIQGLGGDKGKRVKV